MTVGVATWANNGTLFFAADRMLTRGTVQTEPQSAKIYNFDAPLPVTVLWAGSPTLFAEVLNPCLSIAKKHPSKYTTIEAYVDLYCSTYTGAIGKRAERAILGRLGMTRTDLVSNKVSNDRAKYLIQAVTEYQLGIDETVEVILAGHDDAGPHIWRIYDGAPACHDVEGFAAIGIGADHADSQLRFAGFTKSASPSEALILAYLAKRRAELSPGVGKATDLCMRGVDRKWFGIPNNWIDTFGSEYDRFVAAEKEALRAAINSTVEAMAEMLAPVTPPLPVDPGAAPQSPPASTDGQ
jgi:hypothetical protein